MIWLALDKMGHSQRLFSNFPLGVLAHKQSDSLSLHLFVLVRLWVGLVTRTCRWERSCLCRLPIQTLMSFGNSITDTPRSNLLPTIWAPLSPAKLTHKISHHDLHWFSFWAQQWEALRSQKAMSEFERGRGGRVSLKWYNIVATTTITKRADFQQSINMTTSARQPHWVSGL